MRKLLLVGLPMLCLFVVAPMLVAVIMVTLTGQAAVCAQQMAAGAPGAVGAGSIRVVQANIKISLPPDSFTEDLQDTVSTGPDLVSLNEVTRRPDSGLRPAGYDLWRVAQHGDDGTAVLWRTDRWVKVDSGRVIILAHGHQKWDHDRAATWVSLHGIGANTAAGTVSMVSVHQMINPAKYGPDKPLRQQLYRAGMEKLQGLVSTLSAAGPVFVAGDFNSQWSANDLWGPRHMLGAVGMNSTMDVLGQQPTRDDGGTIDYIFYQPVAAAATRQWTQNLNSDHKLLGADLTFVTSATTATPSSPDAAQRAAADVGTGPVRPGQLGLSATQWQRASEVVGAGKAMGISEQGIVIALSVASQESGFRVVANDGLGGDLAPDQHGIDRSLHLPHDAVGSDHGSLGLFQQQWPWWGSMAELMDPAASAGTFYRALLKVPGWQSLPVTDAAQDVQHSGHRDAYADDEALARQVYAQLRDTPATDLYLASNELAECATQTVAAGGNTVVFPVPANLAETDEHNWGGLGNLWGSWHSGTDFAVGCGTPVLASHSGTVSIETTQSWSGPWLVKVSVGPHQLTTWYAHMQKVLVADGQAVTAGQQIGEVGAEGNATGCHLHFEVHTHNGPIYGPDNVNPSTWLAEHVGRSIAGGGPGSFTIATFNTLGDSHTRPGGNKHGWADSTTRTRWMADLLASQGPDVVGLQEFQGPQAHAFHQLMGETWGSFGNKDNVVIWRRGTFAMVSAETIAIPYFYGHPRQMPVVRLTDLATGQTITVISVHNPADVRGPAAGWRAMAVARERTVIARERAAGHPVFLIGDLNDREGAFCPVTAGGLMVSASGGSNTDRCQPPANMNIDWIFGSGATFTGYLIDVSPVGRVSDHPYVEALATPLSIS